MSKPTPTLEDGSCDHSWKHHVDEEGDPDVPNGTRDVSFWECEHCGQQNYGPPPYDFD